MKFALGNAQSIGARTQQQDAFGFSDPSNSAFVAHGGVVAVVADGMGGMAHGDAAGRMAVKTFLTAYESKRPDETIPDALRRSLLAANDAVFRLATEMSSAEEMGTTVVAAVLQGRLLHFISAGDSAIFLYREGELTLLTTPHVYARELDLKAAAGTIGRDEAQSNPDRESLTSYVGMPVLAEIDQNLRPLLLEEGDCVLLASDGLFKTLDEQEIRRAMFGAFQQRCDALVESVLAKDRADQDNVTVIAIGPEPGPIIDEAQPRLRSLRKIGAALLVLMLATGLAAALYVSRRSPPLPVAQAKPVGGAYDARTAPSAEKTPGDKGPAPEVAKQ